MEAWEERLIYEHAELSIRIIKLKRYLIDKDKRFNDRAMPAKTTALMTEQLKYMILYQTALEKRILGLV